MVHDGDSVDSAVESRKDEEFDSGMDCGENINIPGVVASVQNMEMINIDTDRLVAPICMTSGTGTVIASSQPDVEVLCVVLKRFPLTRETFAEASGQADWVRLTVCIVDIGPPGFSRVPYNSSKKKGEKETTETERLYEPSGVSSAAVTMFSYNKGKTNKDRGERVSLVYDGSEGGDQMYGKVDIEPGVCLSFFVREDHYKDGVFLCNANTQQGNPNYLDKYNFVYLQLTSQNVDQAKKGSLVKAKKMKIVEEISSLNSSILKNFPTSALAFDETNNKAKAQEALSKQVFKNYQNLYKIIPAADAYISFNEDNNHFVCVDVDDAVSGEITIPRQMMLQACGTNDISRAMRLGSIAIARGSLNMMIASSEQDGVIMGEQDSARLTAIFVTIDINTFLSLPDLSQYSYQTMVHHTTEKMDISRGMRTLVWAHKHSLIKTENLISGQRVIFVLSLEKETLESSDLSGRSNMQYLGDGLSGPFHRLSIYFASPHLDWDKILGLHPKDVIPVISLQVRPENARTSKVAKRPRFEFDHGIDQFSNRDCFAKI